MEVEVEFKAGGALWLRERAQPPGKPDSPPGSSSSVTLGKAPSLTFPGWASVFLLCKMGWKMPPPRPVVYLLTSKCKVSVRHGAPWELAAAISRALRLYCECPGSTRNHKSSSTSPK